MKKIQTSKTYFTADDDIKLLSIINENGKDDWNLVSRIMENKSKRQCKDRWRNYLDPSLNKATFTDDENDLIRKKVAELGFRWKCISKFFHNRTDAMIRNQYKSLSHMQRDDVEMLNMKDKFEFHFPFENSVVEQIRWLEGNFN
jgi:hypothetical protein